MESVEELVNDSATTDVRKRKKGNLYSEELVVTTVRARRNNAEETLPFTGVLVDAQKDKGKAKLYEGYSFNEGGVLSAKAIKWMESGKLGEFSSYFKQEVVDIDVPLFNGVYARDVLHHAVQGTLHHFMDTKATQRGFFTIQYSSLMKVEEVLEAMEFRSYSENKIRDDSCSHS